MLTSWRGSYAKNLLDGVDAEIQVRRCVDEMVQTHQQRACCRLLRTDRGGQDEEQERK
jgi:hypothetical protein